MEHPKLNDATVLTILPETQDQLPLKGQDLPPTPSIEVPNWNAFFDQDYASCSVWPISSAVNLPERDKFDEEIKKTHPELDDAVDPDIRISAGGGVNIQQFELKDAVPFLVSSLQISNLAKTKQPELNDAAVLTILPETQDCSPFKAKDLPPNPRIEVPDWNAFFDKVKAYASFGGWPISGATKESLKEAFNEETKKMQPQLNDVVDSDIHISAGSGAKIHHPELKNAMLVSNLQISAKIKNPELSDAGVLTILPETQDGLPLHQEDFPPIPRVEVAKDIDWSSFFDQDYASGSIWSSFGAVKEEANAEDNKSDEEAKKDA